MVQETYEQLIIRRYIPTGIRNINSSFFTIRMARMNEKQEPSIEVNVDSQKLKMILETYPNIKPY